MSSFGYIASLNLAWDTRDLGLKSKLSTYDQGATVNHLVVTVTNFISWSTERALRT